MLSRATSGGGDTTARLSCFDKALDHPSFSKEDVKNLQMYTKDLRIVSIVEFVHGCTSGGKTWERLEHALASHIADGLGQAPEQMAA